MSMSWLPYGCFAEAPIIGSGTEGSAGTETDTTPEESPASTSETTATESGETTATEGGETTATEGGETTAAEGGETTTIDGGETEAECGLTYVRFHGTAQSYAEIPLESAEHLDFIAMSFTVELWVRVDQGESPGAYVGTEDDSGLGWSFGVQGGAPYGWAGFIHQASESVLKDGQWHHVAWALDQDVLPRQSRLFVDGDHVGSLSVDGPEHPPSSNDLRIGASDGVNVARAGDLRALRISAFAFESGGFVPDPVPTVEDHTLALWLFDEASGDAAANQLGGPHAQLHDVEWRCDPER
jgi:hypothetical protein